MQKPTRDDDALTHLVYGMCQMRDEKKEACIHCDNVWYSIHYRDGVCNACQRKGLPGRGEIAMRRECSRWLLLGFGVLIMAVLLFVATGAISEVP